MTQSKLGSFYEACANIIIGYGINFYANTVILPAYGCHVTPTQNISMGLIYTAISLARSYVIRRWFNQRLHAAMQRLAGAKG